MNRELEIKIGDEVDVDSIEKGDLIIDDEYFILLCTGKKFRAIWDNHYNLEVGRKYSFKDLLPPIRKVTIGPKD